MSRNIPLDTFRGIAVAAMLLVNNPGSWAAVYWPLGHADWHGLTPADVVFPMFLFAVGAALNFSALTATKGGSPTRSDYLGIIRRALFLFLIGVSLNAFPNMDFGHLRLLGVLQRIAICYLFSAIVFLHCDWRFQLGLAGALLLAYQGAISLVPVPDCGIGLLDKDCNLASHVDRLILGRLSAGPAFDPEGILTTLPALSTTLLGAVAGRLLIRPAAVRGKIFLLAASGAGGVLAGLVWQLLLFPINKNLWSPSFVLLTAGICALVLMLLLAISGERASTWGTSFRLLGAHAILAYIMAEAGSRLLTIPLHSSASGEAFPLKSYIYNIVLAPWFEPRDASLVYAIVYSLLILALVSIVHWAEQPGRANNLSRNRA